MPTWDSAQPASPAMPEPSPKAITSTRAVGTPTHEAMVRFWVTPRMNSPSRVRESASHIPISTMKAKAMIAMRL